MHLIKKDTDLDLIWVIKLDKSDYSSVEFRMTSNYQIGIFRVGSNPDEHEFHTKWTTYDLSGADNIM